MQWRDKCTHSLKEWEYGGQMMIQSCYLLKCIKDLSYLIIIKLFGSFGQGMMHWCGNSNHQLENILNVKEIGAVHNYILGEVDDVLEVQKEAKEKKICLVAGDIIPVEEELEGYLKRDKGKT